MEYNIINIVLIGVEIMDREQILSMDAYMLLSLINMKLRDEFGSLDDFCKEYNVKEDDIKEKLKEIGYAYNEKTNQFIAK
jgi:hypothetical protein